MKTLTFAQYNAMAAAADTFVMLDVRNTDEYEQGHMPDAINIPLHVLPLQYAEQLPDTTATIICCCARGGRASQAAAFLVQQGYTNVVVLEGGYDGYCSV